MSIQQISPDQLELFTIKTNPSRGFSSGSNGVTGSVYVFARRSSFEKEPSPLAAFAESKYNDSDLESVRKNIVADSRNTTNISSKISSYLTSVNTQAASARKFATLDIQRIIPPTDFGQDSLKKLFIKDTLNSYYRTVSPSSHWATTNYWSLNFFTASSITQQPVLIYPDNQNAVNSGYIAGNYPIPGEFTFDFYIKPRYTIGAPGLEFKAGTICHLSSCYAVSLVTGSSKDPLGYSNGFRILLQLSQSANISPSLASPGNSPNNLIFLSDDNSLKKDSWHHVIVRWGTSALNNGTGSFVIDGQTRGTFVIPSSSVCLSISSSLANPSALFVGNFYEGNNQGTNAIARFFALDVATRDGVTMLDPTPSVDAPANYKFQHPLNAELHDLSIKRYYMVDSDIDFSSSKGPVDLSFYKVAFYLPPLFTNVAPVRKFVGTYGGVPQTPFFSADGTTEHPFNVAMSFGVGGHYMNIENFVCDLANRNWPRLLNLTASEIFTNALTPESADVINYKSAGTTARNLLVLPCDDGNFYPNYNVLAWQGKTSVYGDDIVVGDYSLINLNNMVSSSTSHNGIISSTGSLFNTFAGSSPESSSLDPGATFAIYQRTRDASSNEVVIFDISNLYYGNRINPGSVVLTDAAISSSAGRVSITLKDDGLGNLYRCDTNTSASTWNSVGNVYYNEGLILVKNPSLFFFGKDQFSLTFDGEQNIHVMKINAFIRADQLNSSSNPSYLPVSASGYPNDPNQKFVYITNVNFHDENMNVVAKSQLAQPLIKRDGDKYLIKFKLDF